MHPAKSVIFFTVASGAGYGLLAWLAILALFGQLPTDSAFVIIAFALCLGLVTAGLLSSTLHLGHPERAWRALSQWRSSWLSREGVAALLTYVPACLFALGVLTCGAGQPLVIVAVVLAAVGAVVTVACTAMIYASLKTIPSWAHGSTIVSYLVLAGMTGSALAHALLRLWGAPGATEAGAGLVVFAIAGFAVKLFQWSRIDNGEAKSTPESATGLGPLGKVRLLEAPHDAPNYLMKEMGFVIARKHAGALRRAVVVLAFFCPVALTGIALGLGGVSAVVLSVLTVLGAGIGIAVERWLFFAEARHVVTLYYGRNVGGAAKG